LWPRITPEMKVKISLILTHLLPDWPRFKYYLSLAAPFMRWTLRWDDYP
jgi:hypothetical protein